MLKDMSAVTCFLKKEKTHAVLEIAGDKLNYHVAADYRQSAR